MTKAEKKRHGRVCPCPWFSPLYQVHNSCRNQRCPFVGSQEVLWTALLAPLEEIKDTEGSNWRARLGSVIFWAPILLKHKNMRMFCYVLFCFGQVSLCSPDWLRLAPKSGFSCLHAGITSSVVQLLGLLLKWPESSFWNLQSWAVEGKLPPAQVWLDSLFIKQIESWRVKLCQMIKSLHSFKQTFSWQKCYCMFSLESLKICLG